MKKPTEVKLDGQEIGNAYAEALKFVSMSRHIESDQTRQHMADALREFYDLLEVRIAAKRSGRKPGKEETANEIARAKIA